MENLLSKVDELSYDLGKLSSAILAVKTGQKPVAELTIRNPRLKEILETIKNTVGIFYVCEKKGKTHTSIYLFSRPHLQHVVNFLIGKRHNRRVVQSWIEGVAFGYGEAEIAGFISTNS